MKSHAKKRIKIVIKNRANRLQSVIRGRLVRCGRKVWLRGFGGDTDGFVMFKLACIITCPELLQHFDLQIQMSLIRPPEQVFFELDWEHNPNRIQDLVFHNLL